jgi:hypothetical protein
MAEIAQTTAAPDWGALLEGYSRGILTDDQKAMLEEASRRGISPYKIPLENPILKKQRETTEDIAKSFATGVTTDIPASVVGLGGAIGNLFSGGSDPFPGTAQAEKKIGEYIPQHTPTTVPGQIARTAGGFMPAAITAPEMAPSAIARSVREAPAALKAFAPLGNLATATARYAVAPALGSAAGGELGAQATKSFNAPDWMQPAGAMIGALMAPGAATRAITPLPAKSPEWENFVKVLQKGAGEGQGVRLSPAYKAGSPKSLATEQYLGGQPFAPAKLGDVSGSVQDYTKNAMKFAGGDGLATGENLQKLNNDFTNQFGTLTRSNSFPYTYSATEKNINKALGEYRKSGQNVPADVQDFVDRLSKFSASNRGVNKDFLTGKQYQDMHSELGAKIRQADPVTARVLSQIQDLLDDGMSKSIRLTNPTSADAFEKVRGDYRNYLIVRRAASHPDAAEGVIPPRALASAARDIMSENEFTLQQSPMAKFARAGEAVFGLQPGHSGFQKGMEAATGLGPLVAAADTLAATHSPLTAAIGGGIAAGALQVPPTVAAYVRHLLGQSGYLGNQVIPKAGFGRNIPSHGLLIPEATSKALEPSQK